MWLKTSRLYNCLISECSFSLSWFVWLSMFWKQGPWLRHQFMYWPKNLLSYLWYDGYRKGVDEVYCNFSWHQTQARAILTALWCMDILFIKAFYRCVDEYFKDYKVPPILKTWAIFSLMIHFNMLSPVSIFILFISKYAIKEDKMFTFGLFVKFNLPCMKLLKSKPMVTSNKIQCGFPFFFLPMKTISSLSSLHMRINGRKYHSLTRPQAFNMFMLNYCSKKLNNCCVLHFENC